MARVALFCLLGMTCTTAQAQSETLSQTSALSVQASIESAELASGALTEGSELIVTALRPLGDFVQISVEVVGLGGSAVVHVSAEVARHAALAVGGAIMVTAGSAGLLLSAGGAVIAFVPSELARVHLHHREL